MKNINVTMMCRRSGSENLWMDKIETLIAQEDILSSELSVKVAMDQDLISIHAVIDPHSGKNLMQISLKVKSQTGKQLKITPSEVKKFHESIFQASAMGRKASFHED